MSLFTTEQKKIIALSSLGGALEFYDFIVFVFLAKTIGTLFFPAKNPVASLLITLSVFAVGYLARPLGGFIFGHLGDRFGRKKTFVYTILLMALPTLFIGLLPTYQSVGLFASVALVILRLIQGFSVGGEIPGAIVFILESVVPRHRGFATGLILFGINTGLLLGSLSVGLLTHYLSDAQIHNWGWRIPFIVGGLFGFISVYLRKRLQETPAFNLLQKNAAITQLPAKQIFYQHTGSLLQGVAITAFEAVIISILYLFMPTYLNTFFHFPLKNLLALNTITIFLFAVPVMYASFMSDQWGRKKVIIISVIAYLFFSYPIFLLFKEQSWAMVVIGTSLLAILASPVAGCFTCMMAEQFPTAVRYSGTGLAYNIGFGIIGGLTPLIATWLIHSTGNLMAPSFCLIAAALVAFVTLYFVPETYRKELV